MHKSNEPLEAERPVTILLTSAGNLHSTLEGSCFFRLQWRRFADQLIALR